MTIKIQSIGRFMKTELTKKSCLENSQNEEKIILRKVASIMCRVLQQSERYSAISH